MGLVHTYTGVDTDWENLANWDTGQLPGEGEIGVLGSLGDDVIIPRTASGTRLELNNDRSTKGSFASRATLTLAGVALNNETVVMAAKTYTFQTALTDVNGNVLIGADAAASIANLIAAITLGAGAGTTYAASMTVHPTMTAEAATGGMAGASAGGSYLWTSSARGCTSVSSSRKPLERFR